jgi:nucleoid-associated protein YgaU
MGLFSQRHDDDKEREAAQRHRDTQQRFADARRHQQERQQTSMQGNTMNNTNQVQPQTRTVTASSGPQQHSTYPEGSWRKEFDLYVVKRGDTLFGISKQVYADGNQWHRIQEANPIVLKNPDLIHAGLVLRIPKGQGKPLA